MEKIISSNIYCIHLLEQIKIKHNITNNEKKLDKKCNSYEYNAKCLCIVLEIIFFLKDKLQRLPQISFFLY